MQVIKFAAKSRKPNGKKGTKLIRKQGEIPAVIYGGNEDNVLPIQFAPKEIKHLVYSPDYKIVEIDVDGNMEKCVMKDISFHPVTDEIVHVDFLRLIDKRPVKIEIPVKLVGNSVGVKDGGNLIQMVRKVTVKVLPKHLVDAINVDISEMKLGDSIRIKDIVPPEGYEILDEGAIPVSIIQAPRALVSAKASSLAEENETGEGGEES